MDAVGAFRFLRCYVISTPVWNQIALEDSTETVTVRRDAQTSVDYAFYIWAFDRPCIPYVEMDRPCISHVKMISYAFHTYRELAYPALEYTEMKKRILTRNKTWALNSIRQLLSYNARQD